MVCKWNLEGKAEKKLYTKKRAKALPCVLGISVLSSHWRKTVQTMGPTCPVWPLCFGVWIRWDFDLCAFHNCLLIFTNTKCFSSFNKNSSNKPNWISSISTNYTCQIGPLRNTDLIEWNSIVDPTWWELELLRMEHSQSVWDNFKLLHEEFLTPSDWLFHENLT